MYMRRTNVRRPPQGEDDGGTCVSCVCRTVMCVALGHSPALSRRDVQRNGKTRTSEGDAAGRGNVPMYQTGGMEGSLIGTVACLLEVGRRRLLTEWQWATARSPDRSPCVRERLISRRTPRWGAGCPPGGPFWEHTCQRPVPAPHGSNAAAPLDDGNTCTYCARLPSATTLCVRCEQMVERATR